MIALAFALTYSGWTALCFAMPSHSRALRGRPLAATAVFGLRLFGAAALSSALLALASVWRWPIGATAWFGILTISCLLLVFLFSANPKATLFQLLSLPTAAVWLLLR